MSATVEPVRVSPFIKFCRWSLLGAGIIYGISKFEAFSKIQKYRRDAYERGRPAREAKEKAERQRKLEEELAELSKTLGTS